MRIRLEYAGATGTGTFGESGRRNGKIVFDGISLASCRMIVHVYELNAVVCAVEECFFEPLRKVFDSFAVAFRVYAVDKGKSDGRV